MFEKSARAQRSTTTVDRDDDEAQLGKTLRFEEIEMSAHESLAGANSVRTRIEGVDHRISPTGIEGARPIEGAVQWRTPVRSECSKRLDGHIAASEQGRDVTAL